MDPQITQIDSDEDMENWATEHTEVPEDSPCWSLSRQRAGACAAVVSDSLRVLGALGGKNPRMLFFVSCRRIRAVHLAGSRSNLWQFTQLNVNCV